MKNKEEIKIELDKISKQIERINSIGSAMVNRFIRINKYSSWTKYTDKVREQLNELELDVEKYKWDLDWNEEENR